jgi:hypothetical protein
MSNVFALFVNNGDEWELVAKNKKKKNLQFHFYYDYNGYKHPKFKRYYNKSDGRIIETDGSDKQINEAIQKLNKKNNTNPEN